MNKLIGYIQTLRNYYKTDKGRHDTIDYCRAIAIIVFIIVCVMYAAKMLLVQND